MVWLKHSWNRKIAGMAEGLSRTKTMQEKNVLILADSEAAIAAVKKTGKTGKARSKHLQRTVNMIPEIKKGVGDVKLGWVKAHMDIFGNEAADVLAK